MISRSIAIHATISAKRSVFLHLVLVSIVFLTPFGKASNGGNPVTSYIIASPNTRPSLNDKDARLSLESFEQTNAIAVADRIACSLKPNAQIGNALGIYADYSENSFVVETNLDNPQTDYFASLLGRYAHQEFVLFFTSQPNGLDRLWIIRSKQSSIAVMKRLRELQIAPATLIQQSSQTEVLFVDSAGQSTQKLARLSAKLNAVPVVISGTSTLPGDPDRAQAAAIFERKIESYERTNGVRLSSQLWTKAWHDANSTTCRASISTH